MDRDGGSNRWSRTTKQQHLDERFGAEPVGQLLGIAHAQVCELVAACALVQLQHLSHARARESGVHHVIVNHVREYLYHGRKNSIEKKK